MKKAKKVAKKKIGPPFHNGVEPKVSRLFTICPYVWAEFERHCKENKVKKSAVVQALMHEYNIREA